MEREYVESVRFGLFGPDEIKRLSACHVTEASTYVQQLPAANGPCDHRMGVSDRRLTCGTCKRRLMDCPGHLGGMTLAFPVYHPGFLDLTLKLLRCCCFFCSGLMLSPHDRQALARLRDRKAKLALASTRARGARACPSCGGCNPGYAKQSHTLRCDFTKVTFADEDEALYCQRPFTAQEARLILQNMSDEDAALLGLNPRVTRPENFVLTALVVPPPVVRPSVLIADGCRVRGQDDLTTKLCEIVKANKRVQTVLDREKSTVAHVGLSLLAQQAVAELAWHVSTYMNNEARGQRQSVQRNGLPTKSIASRLKGKEGRIRGSLMGKRVNFSARSVVSPDSQMDVDEVGIPRAVAERLTIPEVVTDLSLDALRRRVRAGAGTLLGAHAVRRGAELQLLEVLDPDRASKMLRVGDVVERYLQDGDFVLFNRQPSLHKGSMMGYRVKLMPGSTFRLNLAATSAFNGDFDGDELNVHALQDVGARVEAQLLMSVPRLVVSPQSNKPIIGLVQDSVIGAWLLTGDNVRLTRRQMTELRACLRYSDRAVGPGDVFTGREAAELLLPANLDYRHAGTGVVVERGRLRAGRLCKKTVGIASGGLVHHLWLMHSQGRATEFISDAQRLINRWLSWRGFSIRLSDCEPSPRLSAQIAAAIELAACKARAIEEHPGVQHLPEEREEAVSAVANRVLTTAGKHVHACLDLERNALYQAVTCGSKGNLINMAQLLGLVGQQSVEGRRIGLQGGYPLEEEDGSSLAKHGFVKHSYFAGLSAAEFFCHTMAGREGLIDTSVKTASTGYLQRRLMKAMETLVVSQDGSCRNSRGSVTQLEYGADGYDACYLVKHNLDFLSRPWRELRAEFCDEEREAFQRARLACVRRRVRAGPDQDWTAYSPCAVEALLLARGAAAAAVPLTAAEAAGLVDQLVRDVARGAWGDKPFLEAVLRWRLRAAVAAPLGCDLAKLLAELRRQARRGRAAPGEAVGALAAQSISEPLTQLTLNTFHMAGVKAKNVTLGVPRVKELIDCTRKMKQPKMRLVALPSFSRGEALQRLEASLVSFTLGQAVLSLTVAEEPDFFASAASPLDDELARREARLLDAPAVFCPYVARIRLNAAALLSKGLTPARVADVVEARVGAGCQVVASEATHPEWLLRLRLVSHGAGHSPYAAGSVEERLFLRDAAEALAIKLCKEVVLRGVPGVSAAYSSASRLAAVEDDGDVRVEPCTVVETAGSNLQAVLGMPQLFGAACVSNDVHDVLAALGVEAAAAALFEQLQLVLTFDGNYINERHIVTLVSLMTAGGALLPISRHGINRLQDTGALARASFEEVADQLFEAAAYGDVDPCSDVSSFIMLGQRVRVGTGAVELEDLARASAAAPVEEEEVVFSGVEAVDEAVSSVHAGRPVEMPYSTLGGGSSSSAPHRGFMAALPPPAARYAPSSPKRGIKRKSEE